MPDRNVIARRSILQSAAAAPLAAQLQTKLPNFVFLISDDHSWNGLGCYGNRVVRTPNLDRLASEGMRFENAFVSSPQCSPNRSSIFTGCTPHTTATSRLHTPMPPWERTYLEPLRDRGYFAGAFRKVHQGADFDARRWDWYGNARAPFSAFFDALPKGRPFFLHVGFTDPHRPYKPGAVTPPHDRAKIDVPAWLPDTPEIREDIGLYHDAIARMDGESGEVLRLLKERGLEDNTLVIFTGDNGMPFPRAKGTLYEAGIHVPLIARWPGRIAAGRTAKELIAHVDLPATWLDAAGAVPLPKAQGRSFLPLLTGGAGYTPREAIFSERNWHDNYDAIRSVRTATHKLIFNALPHLPYRPIQDLRLSPTWESIQALSRQGRLSETHMRMLDATRPAFELYDIERDPLEKDNLYDSPGHAEVWRDLSMRLSDWMHETYDYLPPIYDQHPAAKAKALRRRLL